MSKSLKNFITIRELLDFGRERKWDCIADDFRLWCLGLSGSYRKPTTFSYKRLEESRVVREKIIQFLMDAQDYINRCENTSSSSSSKKTTTTLGKQQQEQELFRQTQTSLLHCHHSLMGATNSPDGQGYDLDGSQFLHHLLNLIQFINTNYFDQKHPPSHHPIETIRYTTTCIRNLLQSLGFSLKTVRAGLERTILLHPNNDIDDNHHHHHHHGEQPMRETELVNQLVRFRSQMRIIGLNEKRHDILNLCDAVRHDMEQMGVQISDDPSSSSTSGEPQWKRCVAKPKQQQVPSKEQNDDVTTLPKEQDPPKTTQSKFDNVQIDELFQINEYKGKFSKYDKHGIPILNADGTLVSKTMRKKLMKKQDKLRNKLQQKSGFSKK